MEHKVGIVTWIGYQNFGSFLQAFALSKVVESLGYTPIVIDDTELSERYVLERFRPNKVKALISKIRNKLFQSAGCSDNTIYAEQMKKAADCFESFKTTRLQTSTVIDGIDVCIAGSDQIWSPHFPIIDWYLRHYYLADFRGRKIAYAPSLGMHKEKELSYINKVRPWLEEFVALSAREPGGAEILAKATNKQVPVLLDPTLLLGRNDWEKLLYIKKKKSDLPYCLCYLLTYNRHIIEQAQAYTSRHGLRLIVVLNNPKYLKGSFDIFSGGPAEFIDALYNAETFITDSFHGAVFSTIFEIPAAIYRRFPNNEPNQQNGRIENLFRLIKSDKELISPESDLTDRMISVSNSSWAEHISEKQKEAIEYLANNLHT